MDELFYKPLFSKTFTHLKEGGKYILNVNKESSAKRSVFVPSKSTLNFCKPKLVYLAYVVLKNVLEGLPFSIIFCCPSETKFIKPPAILLCCYVVMLLYFVMLYYWIILLDYIIGLYLIVYCINAIFI